MKCVVRRSVPLLLLLALAPALITRTARAADSRGGEEAAQLSLPFRGWGLTSDYQLVKVFGNATQYSVWWYADLSYLPWDTNVANDGYGGLASDPWNPNYLYVNVPEPPAVTRIYRFNLTNNTTSLVLTVPAVPMGYTLQGFGARCSSKLANLYGGIPFYSHRRFHPATSFQVREITTTGAESTVLIESDGSREGDNAQQHFGGPHWFTLESWDANGNLTWGVSQLGTGTIAMGTNDGLRPTGLLSYGSGAYYVSTTGNHMYVVNTNLGTFNPLTYVVYGAGAYPTAPDLTDLSNTANYCSLVLPAADSVDAR